MRVTFWAADAAFYTSELYQTSHSLCTANQTANYNRFDYLASKNIQRLTRLSILSRL